MSKILSGIFGRPSGQTGGLVFGAARDRTGKVGTIRVRVVPANPNSPDQQDVRLNFAQTVKVVRDLGPATYQSDWDRAVGQLPGWHSLMGILLDAMDDTQIYSAPPVTPLGTLHNPATIGIAASGAGGEIAYTWTNELGTDGTAADVVRGFAIRAEPDVDGNHPVFLIPAGETRASSPYALTGLGNGIDYLCCFYLQGAGTAAGKLTPSTWIVATSSTP